MYESDRERFCLDCLRRTHILFGFTYLHFCVQFREHSAVGGRQLLRGTGTSATEASAVAVAALLRR